MISGIAWVSELIEAAGGIEVFPQLAACKNAKDRIVSADDVVAAQPDIIIGSWCGKKFVPAKVDGASRLFRYSRRQRRLAARDQIHADSPAGAGGAHRRARSIGGNHLRLGKRRDRRG